VVTIVVGSASGEPGESVFFDVTLQAQVNVTGLQNNIAFAPDTAIAALPNGQPICVVNPDIASRFDTPFVFLPMDCSPGVDCTAMRTLLLRVGLAPIASGSLLYTCRIDIAADAAAGSYPLTCSNTAASSNEGESFPSTCTSGSIVVGPPATPTRTPTATPIPPTATVTGTATRTPPPPATPTRTRKPSSNEDDACQIAAPGEHGAAWVLLLPLAALLVRRRRR
jgi:MYXO-CTERM domain-containing protein